MKMNFFEKAVMGSWFRKNYLKTIEFPLLQSLAPNLNGKKILEIGCGPGFSTHLIWDKFSPKSLTAIDIDEKLIALSLKKNKDLLGNGVVIKVADINQLPFPDASFDAIVNFAALHHIIDWQSSITEIRRVLKPEGVFLFEEVTKQWLQKKWVTLLFEHSTQNRFTGDDLIEELETQGLKVSSRFAMKDKGDFIFGCAIKLEGVQEHFIWPKNIKCKACLQETKDIKTPGQVAIVRGNTEKFIGQRFHLFKCPNCQSINSIDKVSFTEIYRDYPVFQRKLDLLAKPAFTNLLNRLKKEGLKAEHRILDVGCGNGVFLQFLKDKGYINVFGFDPYVSEYSTNPLGSFDFVVLNDVIEHVDDPREILRTCKSWLSQNGVLYVGTTCSEFVDMQNPEPAIMLLHQPFHRVIFSKPFLFQLCGEEGFQIQSSYTRSYMDTLIPFANYRFLDEFNKAIGQNMDEAFRPQPFIFFLRNPWLFFFAFFGYFFPSAHEPAVLLKLKN